MYPMLRTCVRWGPCPHWPLVSPDLSPGRNQKNPQTLTASQTPTRGGTPRSTAASHQPALSCSALWWSGPLAAAPAPTHPLAAQTQVPRTRTRRQQAMLRALRWLGLPPNAGKKTWVSVALALASPGSRGMAPGQLRRDETRRRRTAGTVLAVQCPLGAVSSEPNLDGAAQRSQPYCDCCGMPPIPPMPANSNVTSHLSRQHGLLGGSSPQPVQSSQPKPRHAPNRPHWLRRVH